MNIKNNFDEHPVVLFDGICNLCNRCVQAIIKRDPQKTFRFVSMQSPAGQQILNDCGYDEQDMTSVVLIYEKKVYVKSAAALQIIRLLGGVSQYLFGLRILPGPLLDYIYDWIANNRYRWFGKQDVCMIPAPELEDRFLD